MPALRSHVLSMEASLPSAPLIRRPPGLHWILAAISVAIPASLLWDYSWESTVGIDDPWAGPHLLGDAAMLAAALLAAGVALRTPPENGLRLGAWSAPLWTWMAGWGAAAVGTALVFERWWQLGYGLGGGLWPPPQILKTAGFLSAMSGCWLGCREPGKEQRWAFAATGGALLALAGLVLLPLTFPNRQHSTPFFLAACGVFPLLMSAQAAAGGSAVRAATVYTLLWLGAVWLLPLFPGEPLAAPVFHPRDTLLPPPFPLLLIAAAVGVDLFFHGPRRSGLGWASAVECGLAFSLTFFAAQWSFAAFLLSPLADNPIFASGGKQWPFFLQIVEGQETRFWMGDGEALTPAKSLGMLCLAVFSARCGLWAGLGAGRLRR